MADSFRQSLKEFQQGSNRSSSPALNLKQWVKSSASAASTKIDIPYIQLNPLPNQQSPTLTDRLASKLRFCECSRTQKLVGFLICTLTGLLFFSVAAMTLPVVLLKPQKFSLSFTMASVLIMTSFAFLLGPVEYFKHLFSPQRIWVSIAYLSSLTGTLYAVFIAQSFIWVVLFVIVQLIAVVWFYVSYLPGGLAGMKMMTRTVLRTVV